MELVSAAAYVQGVATLARRHGLNRTAPPTILLTTEDPRAVEAFIAAAPPSWEVRHYAPAVSARRHRHGPANDAMATKGSAGAR